MKISGYNWQTPCIKIPERKQELNHWRHLGYFHGGVQPWNRYEIVCILACEFSRIKSTHMFPRMCNLGLCISPTPQIDNGTLQKHGCLWCRSGRQTKISQGFILLYHVLNIPTGLVLPIWINIENMIRGYLCAGLCSFCDLLLIRFNVSIFISVW